MFSKENLIIDFGDIADRLHFLEEELSRLQNESIGYLDSYGVSQEYDDALRRIMDFRLENQDEMDALSSLCEQVKSICGFAYGKYLVREDHFLQLCKNIAIEEHSFSHDEWPFNHIDWISAANERKRYFGSVVYDGVVYVING